VLPDASRDATSAADAGAAGDDAALPLDAGPSGSDASLEAGAEFAARDPAYLFDPASVRTFELWLSDAHLATLDADPAAEEYVPGQLVFEGGRLDDVGIRYKGSAGSFFGCLSPNTSPPSGAKSCVKLGMKIKIDHVDEDARFFRQKKLQFHAMNWDRSLMRERFGYGLFSRAGVHAPRAAPVRLVINGKLNGIYLLVEVIDSPFTRSRFADGGEGNLYKEVWPVGQDEARYLAALETNRRDDPSVAKLMAFAAALADADDATLPAVVEHWIDLDYAARFIAVDRALRHDDGPHHWYCGNVGGAAAWQRQQPYAGTQCGNHNYFWYEDTQAERFWPIPWDLDLSMQANGGVTALVGHWDELEVDCTKLLSAPLGAQMPVTCDRLHRGFALTLRERVKSTLTELAASALSDAELSSTLSAWTDQLEPVVLEANAASLSELPVASWKQQVAALRSTLGALRDAALAHAQQ
jgi:spore coat protein CotH